MRFHVAEDSNSLAETPVVFNPDARNSLRWLVNAPPEEVFKDRACKRQKVVGTDFGHWIICEDDGWSDPCLVYSIGIGPDWSFDSHMGTLGCEVHGFDPTVDHPTNLAPNVTFHKVGLQATTFNFKRERWTFLSLCDMLAVYAHTGRYMDILKIDCEGCEFGALSAFLQGCPNLKPENIGQLLLELHFDKLGGVKTDADVAMVENVVHRMVQLGFRPFWRERSNGSSYRRDLIPEMVKSLNWDELRMGVGIGFINTRRVRPAKLEVKAPAGTAAQ